MNLHNPKPFSTPFLLLWQILASAQLHPPFFIPSDVNNNTHGQHVVMAPVHGSNGFSDNDFQLHGQTHSMVQVPKARTKMKGIVTKA